MKDYILNENRYEEQYNEIILPFCEKHRKDEYFSSFDGNRIHYITLLCDKPKANLLMLHGFTEYAEKLLELAYYFYNEGYSVYIPDLRGHGYSFKDEAPEYAVASHGFGDYATDLEKMISDVIPCDIPLCVFSHSLGGTAILMSLMLNPNLPVSKLVLSSPMICGNMGMPTGIAKALAGAMISAGKGNAPVPGKCEFHPEKGNADATSSARTEFEIKRRMSDTHYQTCGPVFEWVYHSLNARDFILTEGNIMKLKADILLIKPEKDDELLEKYQDSFISLCKRNGVKLSVLRRYQTRHEIFSSHNTELTGYVGEILSFFDK